MKKSTKKILLVHSSNDLYGASKVLILIIKLLIDSGYSIHLILPNDGPLSNHDSIKKVKLTIMNIGVFRKKYFSFFGLLNRLFFIIKSTFKIKKIINNYNIDLVYTNTSTIISSTLAAYLTKIPNLYHIHEIPTGSNLYTSFLVKIFNIFPSKIIAVSNSTRDFWLKKGIVKSKIDVIQNGFNFVFINQPKKHNEIITFTNISRIIPYKGHLFLIELFKEILMYNHNISLQIVGDTLPSYENYLNMLKSKVKEYEIEDKIIFLGYIGDVKSLLIKSNFFIHTPVSPDPFPTVILEAIESKTPVICTDKGGAREILNDFQNGLLIDYDDIKKSAQLILNYLNDLDLQKNNIEDSVKFVSKNFNHKIFTKNGIL